MFKEIIYCSELSADYDLKEVYKILHKSRESNTTIGVSGYLLYGSNNFMQVIEGPEASIKGLWKKISQDSRHHNIKVLSETMIKNLNYDTWSMGFANLTDNLHPTLKEILDEVGLLGDFNPYVLDAKKGLKILRLFAKNSEFLKS
jgi:hypothetical protein